MGLLVGTSLIVIIPEGVETLYKSDQVAHSHSKRALFGTSYEMQLAHSALAVRSTPTTIDDYVSGAEAYDMPGPVIPDSLEPPPPPKTPTEHGVVGIMSDGQRTKEDIETEKEHSDEAHHAWVGVALILGFVLMFLIDKVPQYISPPRPKAKTHNIALNHIGRRFNLSGSSDQEQEESERFLEANHTTDTLKRGFATTTGLVIHAAADGIALGASSSAAQTGLSLIIFFAIMIHKAPAAFGLSSILLRQGLSKRMVRAHLVVFSLAAPAGAILTWIVAQILGSGASDDATSTKWWTGVLLLFSGGTFLYVAMHSMQEVTGGHHDRHDADGHANGSLGERRGSADQSDEQKGTLKDLGAAVFGMILPLFLQVGHAH